MWIVKLGGSLLGSPELPHWLETLVKISDGKVIIVPGGGLFADAVREVQLRTQIGDAVAHHLALLAMDQFGLMLAGMHPQLVTASSELEIAERGWQHRAIIWLPSKMVLADENIPQNWQVTSDSLSAWLANKIGANHLIIVKSKDLEAYSATKVVSLKSLIADDVVDSAFVDFCSNVHFDTWLMNKADYRYFEDGIDLAKMKSYAIYSVSRLKGANNDYKPNIF